MIIATLNGLAFLCALLVCYWFDVPVAATAALIGLQQVFIFLVCLVTYNVVHIETDKERRR